MTSVTFEIEVKYKVSDLSSIKKRLREMGAVFVRKVRQVDIYFRHPCKDLAVSDEALRIRLEEDKSVLTYKGPRVPSKVKVREELSVNVSDAHKLISILSRMGFAEEVKIVKDREEYALGEIKLCLDTVEDLGNFVEIEFPFDNEEELTKLSRRLGLKDVIKKTYVELLKESKI